jgi:hypothetical protein
MLTATKAHPHGFLIVALIMAVAACCFGQSAASRGTISGYVTDPHGAAIPGAHVTIRNADLASVRAVTTDAEGRFVAALLPSGPYLIQVAAPGFTLKKPARVTLGVGSSVQINVAMAIPATSESVTVTGRAPTVEGNTTQPVANRTEPVVSNSLAGLTVTYLPNRDRDFSQFAELAAGVEPAPNNSGLVVAGQRPDASTAAIDGADFHDPLQGGQRGTRDTSFFFPQTVVREFQIVRAGATAEVGDTNAGFINIVTKEGSNKLRGEGFYIGRPSALSSADTFGHSLNNGQNEFGGSIGGPIKKNKAFFYLGAEQDYLNIPYWTQFAPQAPSAIVPSQLSVLQRQVVGHSDPTAIFARTDFLLNQNNTLNLQFNYNRLNASGLNASFLDQGSTRSLSSPDNNVALTGDGYWLRGTLNTLFGSTIVNQVLAQWARDDRNLTPTSTLPEFFINGFGVLGGNSLYPNLYRSESTRLGDDLAIVRGKLQLHLGGDFAYDPARQQREAYLNAQFDYDSLDAFLANDIRRYQQTFITGNDLYSGAVREVGLYVNGKLTLNDKLTLTAGLRWDGQWNPQPTSPNPAIPFTTRIPNDLSQWQPRLGIAWSATSKVTFRASAGIYDAPTPATYFQRVFTDNGLNTVVADSYYDPQLLPLVTSGGTPHALPSVPSGLTTPAALVVGIAPNFHNPRSFQASASVEQQVNAKTTVTAGYVHNSTWDLQTLLNDNLFPPSFEPTGLPAFPAVRPDPAVGQLLVNRSSAHSTYDGMQVTASLQLPKRSQLNANYTLSRTRDNDSNLGPFTISSPLNPFDLASNAAYSSFDVRNSFNLSAITNLPYGFKINPILLWRSGFPYNPVIGFDNQNDGNDWNDRAILNGSVAPRNVFRQPSFFNLDLRIVKDITLKGEGHHLDLFMDIFNITGAGNRDFGPESISLFGTSSAPVYSAAQALFAPDTNHFGSTRQVQFTVRITAF